MLCYAPQRHCDVLYFLYFKMVRKSAAQLDVLFDSQISCLGGNPALTRQMIV